MQEAHALGLRTATHIAVEETTAKDFIDLGVTSIEHFYGVADAALDGIQNFPADMNYADEIHRFGRAGELYAQADPERLLAYGGVHARYTRDPAGDVDRLIDQGIRLLKIHPPHQCFAANAYTDGLDALGKIYRRCEERGLPVMVHTGTSIFPGARSKYGNPMELDDVAIDFPDLPLVMAHGGRPLYMEEAFFILRRHRRVRLDVSGIPPSKLLEYFPRLTEIVDRVLWGTDWPSPGVKDLRQNIDQFLALPLSDTQHRAILEANALALFPELTPE